MIRSMTAFTRVSGSGRRGGWTVEIRSLNHRFFEWSLKAPAFIYAVETRIRDMVQESMRRGKVTLAISQQGSGEAGRPLSFDEANIEFYLKEARRIQKKYRLEEDLTLRDILALPKVLSAEREDQDPEEAWKSLEKPLRDALKSANQMKEEEGRKLSRDIAARLEEISRTAEKIEGLAEGGSRRYFEKLKERVSQLVQETLDEDRLHREVAFLAERTDVTEELVRLKSHIDLFQKKLKGTGEVGRELDFLCQEMNREINTLGSKSQIFEISTDVIFMKKELEKIREQVQNIE